jgi:AcrR family transcriptional regulator
VPRATRANVANTAGLLPFTPMSPLRGHKWLPDALQARLDQERLLYATARAIGSVGYRNATVTEIAAAAGVPREAFYVSFHDKRHACKEAVEHVFRQLMGATAASFFSARCWPEQVWAAGRTFIGLLVAEPRLAYFAFVEAYAAGGDAAHHLDDLRVAFGVFLEPGYRIRPQAQELPRIASEAIGSMIFELITSHLLHGAWTNCRLRCRSLHT